MLQKFYSLLVAAGAAILLLCSGISETLLAQSVSNGEQRLQKAIETFERFELISAENQFQKIIDDYCSVNEFPKVCFGSKLYQIQILRRRENTKEADQRLTELEDFVLQNLGGEINKIAQIYAVRVFLAEQQSDLKKAELWASRLQEIVILNGISPLNKARANSAIGYYETMAGNYHNAITYYQKGIEFAKISDDNYQVGLLLVQLHNNLGISYRGVGELSMAMEQYKISLNVIRTVLGNDHREIGTAYNNIGTIYFLMQDIGQAAEYFARASRVTERTFGPDHIELGAILNNAGASYYALENYELAANYLERAQRVKVTNLGLDHPETAIGFSNLATLHIQNEEFDLAEENFLRSISVRQNVYGENHPDLIDPTIQLGKLYLNHLDKFKRARDYYKIALSIGLDRLGENHPYVADSYFMIGETYHKQQEYDEAQINYKRSIKLLYGDYDLNGEPDLERPVADPIKLIQILQNKAKLLREKDTTFNETNFEKALNAISWAADIVDQLQISYKNEASKLRLVAQNYSIYTNAIEILARLYSNSNNEAYIEQIFEYIEKSRSRVALELIQDISARSFAGVPDEVVEKEAKLNSEITRLQQQLFSENEKGFDQNRSVTLAIQDSVFRKKRELERFTSDLEESYPSYYSLKYDQSVLSLDETKSLLSEGETIISYVLGSEEMFALVVTATDATFINLGQTDDFISDIKRIRNDVISGYTSDYTQTAFNLYENLFAPLEPYFSGKSVLIMVDQLMHYLPFELLLTEMPDHENYHRMPYLIRNYTISYIPSATIFKTMNNRRSPDPRNLLAVAPFSSELIRTDDETLDVQYANALSPLLLTKFETKSISGLFSDRRYWSEFIRPQKVTLLSGQEATLSQLAEINLEEYNFIHFATHAFVNELNPEYSGILMYPGKEDGGIAYVSDIYNMEFNADLVVLGACETGLGTEYRGEGLIGFTRAFIYAGAANLAVSMWKVNDQPTAYLMIDFYDYIRNGYSYNEALRQAKLNIINKPHLADPVNWAAFILTGR